MAGAVRIITGATGLLGSHVAEQYCARGDSVRALVRGSSDTRFLQTLPVEIVVADLLQLGRHPELLEGASTVVHCAAHVRDWGTWQEFHEGTVELTRSLVEGCRKAAAGRFVYVSSISVYGNPPSSIGSITEDTPTGQYLWLGDHYGRAKIMAEQVVRSYADHTIVRPSWIYGRRDHVVLPRVVQALRDRRVRIIGSGENLLNMVSAADVARAIVLATETECARTQTYNLCSRGEIPQRELFDLLANHYNLPRPKRHVAYALAWRAAGVLERLFQMMHRDSPPPFTRRALMMLRRSTQFSIEKAGRDFDWRPEVPIHEGLQDALQWSDQTAT